MSEILSFRSLFGTSSKPVSWDGMFPVPLETFEVQDQPVAKADLKKSLKTPKGRALDPKIKKSQEIEKFLDNEIKRNLIRAPLQELLSKKEDLMLPPLHVLDGYSDNVLKLYRYAFKPCPLRDTPSTISLRCHSDYYSHSIASSNYLFENGDEPSRVIIDFQKGLSYLQKLEKTKKFSGLIEEVLSKTLFSLTSITDTDVRTTYICIALQKADYECTRNWLFSCVGDNNQWYVPRNDLRKIFMAPRAVFWIIRPLLRFYSEHLKKPYLPWLEYDLKPLGGV
jgi:hypothetical protein